MSFIEEVEGLILNKLGSIKTLISMTKLEGKLAKLSIFPLVLSICLILTVLMAFWITLMGIIGYVAWLYCNQIIIALISVLAFNLLFLGLLKKYLLFNVRKMSFEKTRKYFDSVLTLNESNDNEEQKTSDMGDSSPREKITNSTTESKEA